MRRRLADVADKVGVSEATVSRVLNGRPGVSEATRDAVLSALDVLGYERPTSLRGERVRLVGLVLPELQNPIFPALAEIVGGALTQQGLTPVLCVRAAAGGLSESDYVSMLLGQQVSGVIFAGGDYMEADSPHEHYQRLRDRGVPAMVVNGAVDGIGFPSVSVDDAAATEQGFGHLISLGHRRIGLLIGPEDHVPSRRRVAAYTRLAGKAGIDTADAVARTLFSLEAGHAAANKLIRAGVTGIICGSDILALGAIRAVRRMGLDVPADVSVIGYDDSALMTCTDPPLTTIRQPIDAMGRALVAALVHQIEGGPADAEELLFEPELVVRGSTGPVARTGGPAS